MTQPPTPETAETLIEQARRTLTRQNGVINERVAQEAFEVIEAHYGREIVTLREECSKWRENYLGLLSELKQAEAECARLRQAPEPKPAEAAIACVLREHISEREKVERITVILHAMRQDNTNGITRGWADQIEAAFQDKG